MTPPRDRHSRAELTDTGKELLAVLEAEVERIRDERATHDASQQPSGESSEHLRSIAGEVADGRVVQHKLHCLMPGGVLHSVAEKLEKRIKDMEDVQKEQRDFIKEYLGERKFKRFVGPILISFLGSSVALALGTVVFKAIIHSALAGIVKP